MGDPVSQGVEMGYRVIEEYMRQGQKAASMFGMPYRPGAPFGSPQPMDALFQSFSEFMTLWMDMMGGRMPRPGGSAPGGFGAGGFGFGPGGFGPGGFGPGGFSVPGSPGVRTAGPFATETREPPAPAPAPPVQVAAPAPGVQVSSPALTLDIQSAQRTVVSLCLNPGAPGPSLRVCKLRDHASNKPPMEDVHLEVGPGGAQLSLRFKVPETQPPGTYSGLILDEQTNLPCGTLSVRLGE